MNNEGECIMVKVEPSDIDLFNKLIEGYDNLALVTTVDAGLGKLVCCVARNAKKDLWRFYIACQYLCLSIQFKQYYSV